MQLLLQFRKGGLLLLKGGFQRSKALTLRGQGLIGAFAQALLLGSDQLNSTMHIRKTRIIGLRFFGKHRGNAGKNGGFIVLDLFPLDQRFFCGGKEVFRVLFAPCQRVAFGTGAKLQHFSAEACRVVSRCQANQVRFAGISKTGIDLHGGEQLLQLAGIRHQII